MAAALPGLTVGGEIDVIACLRKRQFGLRKYGAIYGAMTSAMNVGTATGALLAGATFDAQRSYATFLYIYITMAAMPTSSPTLATVGDGRFAAGH